MAATSNPGQEFLFDDPREAARAERRRIVAAKLAELDGLSPDTDTGPDTEEET